LNEDFAVNAGVALVGTTAPVMQCTVVTAIAVARSGVRAKNIHFMLSDAAKPAQLDVPS